MNSIAYLYCCRNAVLNLGRIACIRSTSFCYLWFCMLYVFHASSLKLVDLILSRFPRVFRYRNKTKFYSSPLSATSDKITKIVYALVVAAIAAIQIGQAVVSIWWLIHSCKRLQSTSKSQVCLLCVQSMMWWCVVSVVSWCVIKMVPTS